MSRNVGASVRARLLALSRNSGADYNQILTRYAVERLLYRLSMSRFRGDFVLKGAMLFTVQQGAPHRATRDLDLLDYGDESPARIVKIFGEICTHPVEDDGLRFDDSSVRVEEIRAIDEYGGLRVSLKGALGGAAISLQIDIGFGDAVTPAPVESHFPTLLDQPVPVIRTYPRESVVAEKLEAIVKLGMLNTRLKDYFDLDYLAANFEFSGEPLHRAVTATFDRRGAALPSGTPSGLTDAFAADKASHWEAFLGRTKLAVDVPLGDVVQSIRRFVGPVLAAAAASRPFPLHWMPGGPWR